MILDGWLRVESLTAEDWTRVRALVDQYRDLPLGGTDAGLVAIAERFDGHGTSDPPNQRIR